MLRGEIKTGPPGISLEVWQNKDFEEYMNLPRSVNTARLFRSYEAMQGSDLAPLKYCAGWCLAEIALATEPLNNGWRQDALSEAARLWREATQSPLISEDPDEWLFRPEMHLRYKVSLAHLPAQRAVARILAEEDTLPDQKLLDITYENLIGLAQTLLQEHDKPERDPKAIRGIAYEVLVSQLLHRLNNTSRVALPPSARQDFGGDKPKRADVVVKDFRNNNSIFEHLIQVKAAFPESQQRRYSPTLILIEANSELILPESDSAMDTMRAIIEEFDGVPDPARAELIRWRSDELDEITRYLCKLLDERCTPIKAGQVVAPTRKLGGAALISNRQPAVA